ncbi:MAG TPA: hypothetical protein VHM64_20970 [Candidatus Binatia bacterium]|nr:hypothetical protein [Candidatus Binatia bacterium]
MRFAAQALERLFAAMRCTNLVAVSLENFGKEPAAYVVIIDDQCG